MDLYFPLPDMMLAGSGQQTSCFRSATARHMAIYQSQPCSAVRRPRG